MYCISTSANLSRCIVYYAVMKLDLFLYILLIAFVTTPGVFFRVPLKRPLLVALAHGTLFFICLWVGSRLLNYSREGYASSPPLFKNPKVVYDYCMEKNQPPFIASVEDAENHCLSRIAGSGYQPELKKKSSKKVTFAM